METANSFDRGDALICQRCAHRGQRGFAAFENSLAHAASVSTQHSVAPRANLRPHLRPALRTRVGLRMKAPVCGIVILRIARRAHRERSHRSEWTVVGNVANDG